MQQGKRRTVLLRVQSSNTFTGKKEREDEAGNNTEELTSMKQTGWSKSPRTQHESFGIYTSSVGSEIARPAIT